MFVTVPFSELFSNCTFFFPVNVGRKGRREGRGGEGVRIIEVYMLYKEIRVYIH